MAGGKLGVRRGLIVALGVLVLAIGLSACGPLKRSGQVCTPDERDMWANDGTYLLRCINGKWRKSVTIAQADKFWAAVKAKNEPPKPPPGVVHPNVPSVGSQRPTIATGDLHSCAVKAGLVRCWGSDSTGQLGTAGPNASSPAPVTVTGITNAISVTASGLSTCALLADGTAKCWGDNTYGQLGIGHLGNEPGYDRVAVPTPVVGLGGLVQVDLGPASACALRKDGSVFCWGSPDSGRLGNRRTDNPAVPNTTFPNYDSYPTPQWVSGLARAVSISVGGSHACALRNDGSVWCWGSNGSGQLGNGAGGAGSDPAAKLVTFPVPMRAFSASIMFLGGRGIAASVASTCVLDSVGQTLCVGENSLGMLGFGEGSPILPGFANLITQGASGVVGARRISAGSLFHCAPLIDGSTKCWGKNDGGQLGVPYGYSYVSPRTVTGLTAAVEVAGGAQHSCARRTDNSVWCWGVNARGQLGDGKYVAHYVAKPVVNL